MNIRILAAAALAAAAVAIPAGTASASVTPIPQGSFIAHVTGGQRNSTVLTTGAHLRAGEGIRLSGGQRFSVLTASWNGAGTVFTVSPLPASTPRVVLFTLG